MRVLVTARARASRAGRPRAGARWPLDGELVGPPTPGAQCGGSEGRWVGLAGGDATDAAWVVDLDLQREGLVAAFVDACLPRHGFDGPDELGELDQDGCPEWVTDLVDQQLDLAGSHAVGTLISLADGQPVAAVLPLSA